MSMAAESSWYLVLRGTALVEQVVKWIVLSLMASLSL